MLPQQFQTLPILVRATVIFIIMFIPFAAAGIPILRLLIILLKRLFQLIYIIIGTILGWLHKIHPLFVKINWRWTALMGGIDRGFGKLYDKMFPIKKDKPKSRSHRRTVSAAALLCVFLLAWISIPSVVLLENNAFLYARSTYLSFESSVFDKLNWQDENDEENEDIFIQVDDLTESPEITPITKYYIVVNIKSRLGVRDEASLSGGEALEWLVNGDVVLDLGERSMGDVENGETEEWAQVQTENGNVGWTRLKFLEEYSELENSGILT